MSDEVFSSEDPGDLTDDDRGRGRRYDSAATTGGARSRQDQILSPDAFDADPFQPLGGAREPAAAAVAADDHRLVDPLDGFIAERRDAPGGRAAVLDDGAVLGGADLVGFERRSDDLTASLGAVPFPAGEEAVAEPPSARRPDTIDLGRERPDDRPLERPPDRVQEARPPVDDLDVGRVPITPPDVGEPPRSAGVSDRDDLDLPAARDLPAGLDHPAGLDLGGRPDPVDPPPRGAGLSDAVGDLRASGGLDLSGVDLRDAGLGAAPHRGASGFDLGDRVPPDDFAGRLAGSGIDAPPERAAITAPDPLGVSGIDPPDAQAGRDVDADRTMTAFPTAEPDLEPDLASLEAAPDLSELDAELDLADLRGFEEADRGLGIDTDLDGGDRDRPDAFDDL